MLKISFVFVDVWDVGEIIEIFFVYLCVKDCFIVKFKIKFSWGIILCYWDNL